MFLTPFVFEFSSFYKKSLFSIFGSGYNILRPIVEARGYDVSMATRLCELPCVYCDTGYRRRVPIYNARLLDADWVGREYQLIMEVLDQAKPAIFDPSIAKLRRINFLWLDMNAGPIPPGIENLTKLKLFALFGNRSHGAEGPLPAGFWSLKTRMFAMNAHGPQFTGHLEAELPICQHLDFHFLIWDMPGLTGDISSLAACKNTSGRWVIHSNKQLRGNLFELMLNFSPAVNWIEMGGCDFSGQIPFQTGDKWAEWCRARVRNGLNLDLSQIVNGPMPAGFAECSRILTKLKLQGCGLTGVFPMNFTENDKIKDLDISNNQFTGPLPDIPAHVTAIGLGGFVLHNNRFSSRIPRSWWRATNLSSIDLSNCGMLGELPDVPPSLVKLNLKGNRFRGPAPASWLQISALQDLDVSFNAIAGMPFSWGHCGSDPQRGMHLQTYNYEKSKWPLHPNWSTSLKLLDVSHNPLGIHVGFLLCHARRYEVLEVLKADSCNLHGHIVRDDLLLYTPNPTGSLSYHPGFRNLFSLLLASNRISNFGYEYDAAAEDACWSYPPSTLLPALKVLSLRNCSTLQKISPAVISNVQELDLRGAVALHLPVSPSAPSCVNFTLNGLGACAANKQPTCLYLLPVFSSSEVLPNQECGRVEAQRLGDVLGDVRPMYLLVDAWHLNSSVLCHCLAGFGGRDCKPCGRDRFRSVEDQCRSCPKDSTSHVEAAVDIESCKCAKGRYMELDKSGYAECQACPFGRYQALEGLVGQNSCQSCADNMVTTETAAIDRAQCVCPKGLAPSRESLEFCEACPMNTHKDTVGNNECTACTTGRSTIQKGVSDVTNCVCDIGTYSTDSRECQACGSLRTTSEIGASSNEECVLQWGWIVVIIVVPLVAIFVTGIVLRIVLQLRGRMHRMREQALEVKVKDGLSTVKHLAYPMVLTGAWDFKAITEDQMMTLHEGLRLMGKHYILDTLEDIQVMQNCGFMILFFSYQWLSWNQPGPNSIQWEWMQIALGLYCELDGHSMGKTYVWLDIFSIPQNHDDCKLLAVNSLYAYATSANALIIIAPESTHMNTGDIANLESYKSRVWCRVEQVAHMSVRGLDTMFIMTGDQLTPVTDTWMSQVVRIFEAQMTCCRLKHNSRNQCDQESLVLPLLGLWSKLIANVNSDDQKAKVLHALMCDQRDQVFPKCFKFVKDCGAGDVIEERVLFGDLIERVERRMMDQGDGLNQMVATQSRQPARVGRTMSWEYGNPDAILPGWGVGARQTATQASGVFEL